MKLQLTGIFTPPPNQAWRPNVGFVRFDPADEQAERHVEAGYRPAWPLLGVPSATGTNINAQGGGPLEVPGEGPGVGVRAPLMRVSYELETTSGSVHRGSFLWRAVSSDGKRVDIRTPSSDDDVTFIERPGLTPQALTEAQLGTVVARQSDLMAFTAPIGHMPPAPNVDFETWGIQPASKGVASSRWLQALPSGAVGQSTLAVTLQSGAVGGFCAPKLVPPEGWRILWINWNAKNTDLPLPLACSRNNRHESATVALNGEAKITVDVMYAVVQATV